MVSREVCNQSSNCVDFVFDKKELRPNFKKRLKMVKLMAHDLEGHRPCGQTLFNYHLPSNVTGMKNIRKQEYNSIHFTARPQ